VFALGLGQKPKSAQAIRAYLCGMLNKAGIDKKISPHKLRHTHATSPLDAGTERVDSEALLGHESIATTRIYTNCGAEADGEGAVVNVNTQGWDGGRGFKPEPSKIP
jgi:integrase/recombinase XerD